MFDFENIFSILPILLIFIAMRVFDARRKNIARQKEEERKRALAETLRREEEENDDDEDVIPPWIRMREEYETTTAPAPAQNIANIIEEAEPTADQPPIIATVKNEQTRPSAVERIDSFSPLKKAVVWAEILGPPKGL